MKAETISAALADAALQLAETSETPRLDAELLMAHALSIDRNTLVLQQLESVVPNAFSALLDRRLAREPIAYILGQKAFWTIDLTVGPGVLIPRPDSETLIEAAIAHFKDRSPAKVLDLGTGPGTLLLSALSHWPDAIGVGADQSEIALEYAKNNAKNLGLDARCRFTHSDWTASIDGAFDLILCNPPYVENDAALTDDIRNYEPHAALFAGKEGLDEYRRLIPQLAHHLAIGGVICLEIGAQQAAAVGEMIIQNGLHFAVRQDLAGRDRCLCITV